MRLSVHSLATRGLGLSRVGLLWNLPDKSLVKHGQVSAYAALSSSFLLLSVGQVH